MYMHTHRPITHTPQHTQRLRQRERGGLRGTEIETHADQVVWGSPHDNPRTALFLHVLQLRFSSSLRLRQHAHRARPPITAPTPSALRWLLSPWLGRFLNRASKTMSMLRTWLPDEPKHKPTIYRQCASPTQKHHQEVCCPHAWLPCLVSGSGCSPIQAEVAS
jgi:hypothetical protein